MTAKILSKLFQCKGSLNSSVRLLQSSSAYLSGELSFRPVIPQEVLEPSTASLFTEAHNEIRATMRKIIDNDINPHVGEWEKAGQFPRWVFKKFGEAGLLGVHHPVEFGGGGLDFSYAMAVCEELGRINCGGVPLGLGAHMCLPPFSVSKFGSDYLKKTFLKPALQGDQICCLGVSEPQAGSDVAGLTTKAVASGDDLLISGQKMWITNGMQADWCLVLANTDTRPELAPHRNKSLIVVPMNERGIERRLINKMGCRSSDTAQLFFEEVRVPKTHVVGELNQGFIYQMLQFQEERMWGVASMLYPLERVISETIDYTRTRKTFGQPVLSNQHVYFVLSELMTEVEAVRSMLYRTCSLYLRGVDTTTLVSMAKLKAGKVARRVADECLQFWGGMGFTDDVHVSRFYRDSRLLSIGGGTDEMMLMIIAKQLGILPKLPKKQSK